MSERNFKEMIKSEYLRQAADAIESGIFFYNWRYQHSCNVGVVVCAVQKLSSTELKELIKKEDFSEGHHLWSDYIGSHCSITGIPITEILRSLVDVGFTMKEIVELETLKNFEIQRRAEIFENRKKNRNWIEKLYKEERRNKDMAFYEYQGNIIKYLRAWADMIDEKRIENINEDAKGYDVDETLARIESECAL